MRACEAYLSASCRHATHNLKLSRFRCEDRLALWKVGLRDALFLLVSALALHHASQRLKHYLVSNPFKTSHDATKEAGSEQDRKRGCKASASRWVPIGGV